MTGLSKKEVAKARDAMWSVAFHLQRRTPPFVPEELRPIALDPAIEIVAELDDPMAPARIVTVALELVRAANLAPLGTAGMAIKPQIFIPNLIHIALLQRQIFVSLSVLNALGAKFRAALDQEKCSFEKVPSTIFKGGTSKQSTMTSEIVVKRPLRQLAKLLDPRRWDACSLLFRETYTVQEIDGRYRPYDNGKDIGQDWSDLLFERVESSPIVAENVLKINFFTDKNADGAVTKIMVANDLFESVSNEFAGITFPGRLQQDSGWLCAVACEDDPENKSIVTSVKRVNYGRLMRWSGGGSIDFGEILNYLAPALLTLWTLDVRQLIACCDEDDHPVRSKKRKKER